MTHLLQTLLDLKTQYQFYQLIEQLGTFPLECDTINPTFYLSQACKNPIHVKKEKSSDSQIACYHIKSNHFHILYCLYDSELILTRRILKLNIVEIF